MSKIDSLKARQQETVTDAFVTKYDYIDENGDKIKDESFTHPELGEVEEKVNMSSLLQTGLSTTTDIEHLVVEAKLMEDGRIGNNPHIPATMEILEQAKSRIEARDLTPAWTVFDESATDQPATSEAGAD